jgi:hypothetical protein
MTTKSDIAAWFQRGISDHKTHMIVVVDTYDHEDYPVYVSAGENSRTKAAEYNGKDMQRVMEVYNLSLPMEAQLSENRAFNY